MLFLLFSIFVAISAQNQEDLCSNGAQPGMFCVLVPTSGYECPVLQNSSGNSTTTKWCESFNGTYKCCEQSKKPCRDRSAFCRLTKHLCSQKSSFSTMKSKCEYSCGFCGIDSFEQVGKVKQRMRDEITIQANQSECAEPRKCVFPKSKMLTTNRPNNTEGATTDAILGYRKRVSNKATFENTTEIASTTVITDRSTTNETTSTSPVKKSTSPTQLPQNLTTEILITSTSGVTLPKNFNNFTSTTITRRNESVVEKRTTTVPFESRKIRLEELMSSKDSMPKITTAEPSSLSTSLSKTIIKGTCYDEYIYCREFSSLCSHPTFSDVMSLHCSLTCDRCEDLEKEEVVPNEKCEDISVDCANYTDLCENSEYQSVMKNLCPKSCGHCRDLCQDRHQNCAYFENDGFCDDEMYTKDERTYLCGKTCKLC